MLNATRITASTGIREMSLGSAKANAARAGVADVALNAQDILVTFTDGTFATVPADRLLDNAPDRFDAETGQRRGAAVTAAECALDGIEITDDGVNSSRQALRLSFAELREIARPNAVDFSRRRRSWRSPNEIGRHDARGFIDNLEIQRIALADFVRDGACVLEGLPETTSVDEVVGAFGPVRETNYGRVFDVKAIADPDNLASTALPLAPHTDNPYRASPPDIQILVCRSAAESGGETILVDGLAAAQHLRAHHPTHFDVLARVLVRFHWGDGHHGLAARAPVIACAANGEIERIRVNDRALRDVIATPPDERAWRAASLAFQDVLQSHDVMVRLTLRPGDVLMLDNRTILHGRTGFADASRWLQGCYADIDGLFSTLDRLETKEAARRVDESLALLAGPAGDQTYGESLSLRAHSLQAAHLACEDGCPELLIAAALLHDIGWAADSRTHEASGAAFVAQRFGAAVAAPIALHVAAKRYLTGVDPRYLETLSHASRETLAMQGGPMDPAMCAEFLRLPGAPLALRLRGFDDAAKNPDAEVAPLLAYRPLLTRLARAALSSEEITT